jgi:hypothetical protein
MGVLNVCSVSIAKCVASLSCTIFIAKWVLYLICSPCQKYPHRVCKPWRNGSFMAVKNTWCPWNLKFHYHVHKIPLLDLLLTQMNPDNALILLYLKIVFYYPLTLCL